MSTDFLWMRLLIPEGIVVLTALMVLTVDLLIVRRGLAFARGRIAAFLTCLGCVSALAWLALAPDTGSASMLPLTPLTQFLKCALLVLTCVTALISISVPFTRHVGECFALLLLAATGMMLLVSSDNLLLIFVALELLSLPLYILTAFNKANLASVEAGLKYFLFGGMAAAFALFGISLLYGITGEIQLGAIASQLKRQPVEPVFYLALVMVLAGFAFKLAAAPFHFWAPDAYEGAPAPIASFIASASKVASFFVLARILISGFASNAGSAVSGGYAPGWMPLLAVLAVLSIGLGNLAALVQTSVKRLLAYSAIAHTGYGLLALLGSQDRGLPALLFYVIGYALAVLGAFAVISALENSGSRARMEDFAGLSRRSPLLAFCMLVFVLSLAGIPPLPGFFGKFYVFTAAAAGPPGLGLLWLVVLAIAASVISLYYYLQILKQVYAVEPSGEAIALTPPILTRIAIALLCAAVIVVGCAPNLLLNRIFLVLQSSVL